MISFVIALRNAFSVIEEAGQSNKKVNGSPEGIFEST